MTKLRMKAAAALMLLGGAAILPGCGFYTDSNGKTCIFVLVVPICNS